MVKLRLGSNKIGIYSLAVLLAFRLIFLQVYFSMAPLLTNRNLIQYLFRVQVWVVPVIFKQLQSKLETNPLVKCRYVSSTSITYTLKPFFWGVARQAISILFQSRNVLVIKFPCAFKITKLGVAISNSSIGFWATRILVLSL